ncbi:uncharacterized protein DFL_009686 [Arthrobotrys flagrans]|uniref:Uncharacterized protein n=1 Tax=Arthrobotrys flagrans TaxID=97331 RepID=A0A436ZSF0_ARTFL|nr:hypothetical protein DFL_009686 [Arthrobotrys flagrans]
MSPVELPTCFEYNYDDDDDEDDELAEDQESTEQDSDEHSAESSHDQESSESTHDQDSSEFTHEEDESDASQENQLQVKAETQTSTQEPLSSSPSKDSLQLKRLRSSSSNKSDLSQIVSRRSSHTLPF